MQATADFIITPVQESKLKNTNLENIPFGKYFTDHMLEVDCINGQWQTAEIKPYQPLIVDPSLAVFHYGQAIFEGIKAYKSPDGAIQVFRPYDNFNRFNLSAERMQMPQVPEEIFMGGLKKLILLDKDWVPEMENHSLYIRPFMISTDQAIGVKPSSNYKFLIILSPTGPYYNTPMRIHVEEKYVRAAPGGIGFAKAAGNYGGALYPSAQAHLKGYDQVLWMDAIEHKFVQECGTMNVFFIIGDKAITPSLEEGTILAGVTRDSVIQLLGDMNIEVEERPIQIDEITDAYKSGQLKEIFGTGTAATIALIKELTYKDNQMKFDVLHFDVAGKIKKKMDTIRYGLATDTHNWLLKIS